MAVGLGREHIRTNIDRALFPIHRRVSNKFDSSSAVRGDHSLALSVVIDKLKVKAPRLEVELGVLDETQGDLERGLLHNIVDLQSFTIVHDVFLKARLLFDETHSHSSNAE